MPRGLVRKIARTKNFVELMAREAFGVPMNFYFLDKNAKSGLYYLDKRIVKAVPVGGVREIRLELTDEETRRGIKEAMTRARLNEPGFDANAVYIRRKNGTIMYGRDVTQYQPLRKEDK